MNMAFCQVGEGVERSCKPRVKGLTMILDKGLGLEATADYLELVGDYVDLIKLGFGTGALYRKEYLKEKIRLISSYDIEVYPGGTLLEAAIWQGRVEEFFKEVSDLGLNIVEVSDGTIEISLRERERMIRKAVDYGFRVLSEVGKKQVSEHLGIEQIRQTIQVDLANGVEKIIVEGRESGRAVGIYDNNGHIEKDELEYILSLVPDRDLIIWEAPRKEQQEQLCLLLGPDVSLGNVALEEVMALEALRRGLRGDTLKQLRINRKVYG